MSNDNGNKLTDAGAIIDAMQKANASQILTIDDGTGSGKTEQILVTTDASGVRYERARDIFADLLPAPPRRKGTIVTHDLASFVAATNRDKREESIIFADVPARRLTAVLDFHGPADSAPAFGEDRVTYGFLLSRELSAWMRAEKEGAEGSMDQRTFSRIVDDRLGDIGDGCACAEGSIGEQFAARRGIKFADVSDLVAFTRTIAAKSATDSTEVYDEATGSTSIQYAKRNDVKTPDGAPVPVPAAFLLTIPVLNGDAATQFNIPVRLRYDIGEKGIRWRIELHALDKFIAAAIEEALVTVRRAPGDVPHTADDGTATVIPGGCGLPVYLAAAP